LKPQARRAREGSRVPVDTARRTRDASAKSAPLEESCAGGATQGSGSELAEDLLFGAVAIAKELNWRDAKGRWNVRRVYNIYCKRALPIHHLPGLGICARKSSLRKFFSALDDRVLPPENTATK
jgi:hypothetical protein